MKRPASPGAVTRWVEPGGIQISSPTVASHECPSPLIPQTRPPIPPLLRREGGQAVDGV